MQRLIIGDIHGCWIEFQELLDQAGLSEGDQIIAIGDIHGCWIEFQELVGHRHYRGDGLPLIVNDHVWAIDTGCVRGSRLTGLLLPSFKLVSVPARENYWSRLSQSFVQEQNFAPEQIKEWANESE